MPKEVLEFESKRAFTKFSEELDRLCATGKLELLVLPSEELTEKAQFYKNLSSGAIWLLKMPQDTFNGSFTILPKVTKRNPLPKFEPMFQELMGIWKRVALACFLIIVAALLGYYFFLR